MHPQVTKTRHVEFMHPFLGQADDVGDAVLHGDGESVAKHTRSPQAPVQLLSQDALMLSLLQSPLETTDETDTGLEDGMALADGNSVRSVPGELPQGADHGLVRTLGAIFGERGLNILLARITRKTQPEFS